jgi:hypothetical protein
MSRQISLVARVSFVAAAVLLVAGRPLAGQGTRAGILLTLPTSTRALGLGDASSAAIGDEWSVFSSPAQLARATRFSAGLASEGYLASTQLSALAVAIPLWRGMLGLGATMLDYGTVKEIASSVSGLDGVETGRTVSADDEAFEIGFGMTVPPLNDVYGLRRVQRLRVGMAVEVIRTRIVDLSATGVAVSFGAGWTSAGGWDFSAAAQHIGPPLTLGATSGPLPVMWRGAIAAPAAHFRGMTLRPMAEGRAVRGGVSTGTGAAELTWPATRGAEFAVRAGYTVHGGAGDDRSPVSFGAGVVMGRLSVDYAMERFTRIDQVTHRIGIRFARPSADPARQPVTPK